MRETTQSIQSKVRNDLVSTWHDSEREANTARHRRMKNNSPKFSPPQMSMALSYFPRWLNQALSITNSPPAMMGVLQKGQGEEDTLSSTAAALGCTEGALPFASSSITRTSPTYHLLTEKRTKHLKMHLSLSFSCLGVLLSIINCLALNDWLMHPSALLLQAQSSQP